jgi:hypothetical protein
VWSNQENPNFENLAIFVKEKQQTLTAAANDTTD